MPNLDAPSSEGQPIADSLKHTLETVHHRDLSAVRIHEGNEAVHLGVQAFVTGEDIYFAPGQTPPPLAEHEAWHVVQQTGRPFDNSSESAARSSAAEPVAAGLVEVSPASDNSGD